LVGVLFGLHRPDSGRILVQGNVVGIDTPHEAIKAGFGFVQQHFSLIPTLTVVENILLSEYFGVGRNVGRSECVRRIRALAERHGLEVDPFARVEQLSVSEQQRVELIKALLGEPKILILDEPAALLSAQEIERLWQVLRELAGQGVAIILISHKLEDVLRIADRITVLRQGKKVATMAVEDADETILGELMIGDLKPAAKGHGARPASRADRPILEVRDLTVAGERAPGAVKAVSLDVHEAEILGIAGLDGSGQVELLEALAGIRRAESGRVDLRGEDITGLSIRHRQHKGIAYVPPDRRADGLVGSLSIAENFALGAIGPPPVSRYGIIQRDHVAERATGLVARFDIACASPRSPVSTLSGGNQQKVILARELSRDPSIILCCYPTRGLDFAACSAVHEELRRCRDREAGIVIVSMDLDELLELADRIIVMQGGRITGQISADRASAADIGIMMGGGVAC
jgi:simple sugar transport system ATP-binding protein